MRENRTYGSVRGGQSNLIPSTRLTAALPLRVVVGALKGASINAALRQQEKPYNRPAGVEMHSPFGGWRHHLSPSSRGHYKAPLCCELLMKGLLFRALFCPRLRGKSGKAGKGEASAASQSAECLSCHMILEVNPVTLTL